MVYAVITEAMKPLQLVGQAAEFKFESKFEPLQALWLCLHWLDWQAQTQGVSE